MRFLRRLFQKQTPQVDRAEERFDAMMTLIKDLPRADYNRLKAAMDLGYNAYQKVRNVLTVDEKETADIDDIDESLSGRGGE